MYVLLLLLFFRPKPIRAVQFIGTMAKVTFARGGKARGYGTASVCIDYKKAFDLIDHGQSFYQSLRHMV